MNNYPISVAELAEGINNAGSMLAAAGNSYEETIAMLAAANTTVQDISKASTGLRTVAARIRNTKTELDDLGEAMTEADYEALVQGLTKYNVALTDAQGNFRSTYDIIKDLAAVWDQLSNIEQAALAKTLAGTRQQNVFYSLIGQFQEAENAMGSMADSAGALSDAMDVFESTTTAHLNALKTAFLELSNAAIDSDFLKDIIDIGTKVIEIITWIIEKLGGLNTILLITAGILITIKAESILAFLGTAFNKLVALVEIFPKLTAAIQIFRSLNQNIAGASAAGVNATGVFGRMSAALNAVGISASSAQLAMGAFVAIVTVAILAINAINRANEERIQKEKQAASAAIQSGKNAASVSSELSSLIDEYLELYEASKDNEDAAEQLASVQDTLVEKLGITEDKVKDLIKEYGNYVDALKAATVEELKRQEIDIRGGVEGATYDAISAANDYGYSRVMGAATIANSNAVHAYQAGGADLVGDKEIAAIEALQAITDITATVNKNGAASGFDVYLDGLTFDSLNNIDGVLEAYDRLGSALIVIQETIGSDNAVYKELHDQYVALQPAVESYRSSISALNDNLAEQFMLNSLIGRDIPKTVEEFETYRQQLISDAIASGRFIGTQEEITAAVDNKLKSQNEFRNFYQTEHTVFDTIKENAKSASEETKNLEKTLSSLQSVLSKQSTGNSVSLDDFNSEELSDYTEALEYHNGVLQLNAEKTRELVEAKTANELATISENKALAQSQYLENAREIEHLTEKIRTNTYEEGENKATITEQINVLKDKNYTLLDTCAKYDVMSASLREATDAYHNWLNTQKASQAGDMFDDTLNAINRINDTLNNTDSDYFGRVGRTDYQAALDLIIPDTVDSEDKDAVNSYLDSIADLFTYDDKGNRAGLNITNFCKQAVEQGLMVFDEASNSYLVAGQTTMEDFAEGMNLSLPLVQAMFGEMEEFGGKFSWADEAIKTVGDLAISANVAADKLRGLHGDFDVTLDYSDLETTAEKLEAIDYSISDMQGAKAHIIEMGLDPSELDDVNAIIQYLVVQKQQLTAPAVMNIDISKVSENTGAALQLLQDFQTACNDLELKQELGLDTTDAQAEVDRLYGEITNSDNDALLTLGIDTTSIDTVKTSLGELSQDDLLIKLGLDESVLLDYTPEDKDATVHYNIDTSKVDAYNPKNLERTVTYYVRTSGMDKLNGTAHAGGTAFASGDWGTAPGGKTLVGELGKELLVDVHTGRWYTVGDNGAEFINVPRGAIVFNHKQTESLLKNGYVAGRASALVGGTAMVTGGIGADNAANSGNSGGNKPYSGGNYGGNSGSTSSGKSSSSSDKEPQIFDWIEVAIARIEREIKKLKTVAESTYKSLKTKLGAAYDEIAKVNKEIAIQQQGYNRYLKQAESVGLSADLKAKVQNGTIDINEYDEDTQKLIKDYQQWYEKALACADAVDELHESLAKLYEDNFNATQEDFENKLSLIEHMTNMYQSGIDMFEAKGYLESTKFYKAMQAANSQRIATLNQELVELQQKFFEAMASGEIEEGSEAWYKMQQEINSCKEAIADANVEAAQFAKTIREIEWGYFDYEQERISQLTQEADFLIDLMSNQDLHDDKGQLTEYGMATMGLHGQNYNVYMAQADDYAKEILSLNEQIANDPYNTDLIKRREELIKLQQESIKNAENEKQAIVELVRQGIQIELSALKDLIDAYKESLDNAKALYDYQSKVTDKAAEIARIQKQLAAYSGDTSEETQATVQKLEVDLSKAQEDLAKTEYEQFISDQKKLLDELYDEYEEILNQRLDNIDALLEDMIGSVNENADSINETIGNVASDVGYTLTPEMQNIWNGSTDATNGVISMYGDDFKENDTAVNNVLDTISANVADMIEHSDEQADDYDSGVSPTTEPTPPPETPGGNQPQDNGNDNGSGSSGAVLDENTKKKVAAAIWRGGLGWGTNPDRAKRLTEVFGANNGIQSLVNQGVGKNDGSKDVNEYSYLAMRKKFKGYLTGGLVDYTGLAKVDGSPARPELMLNANDTENFLALRDYLRELSMQPLSFSSSFSKTPLLSGINDMSKQLASIRTPVGNAGTTFGDFEINIPIENVQDYNDFVQQLRSDPQFEEMIIDMTLGRAMGKSPLSKYKYQW